MLTNFKIKRQRGSIILFALLTMIVATSIGVGLLQLFIPKLRLINEASHSVVAAYAADTAVELCLFESRIQPAAAISRTVPAGAPSGYTSILSNESSFFITQILPSQLNITADCRPIGGASGTNTFTFRATGHSRGVTRSFEVNQ